MEQTEPNCDLSSNNVEVITAPSGVSPLPRAVLRPNAYVLLDGEWKFDLDLKDIGLREAWYLAHKFGRIAIWPGSIESHMAEAKERQQDTPAWQDKVIAWYEREFEVPEFVAAPAGSILQLTFGTCGYETRVWLNGQPLSTIEGEEIHYGGYTGFSYELPVGSLRPVNRITVRIADTMDAEIPRGKQESHVYQRGGIWYRTHTGATRSVWLEAVERNRLRSRVDILSVVEDGIVCCRFTTRISDPGLYTLRLTVLENTASPSPLVVSEYPLRLESGQKGQQVDLRIPGVRLWSPAAPNLYLLIAQLIDADGHAAQIETHFGLRKVEARGRSVYLNNAPIYLDGILYQPGASTYEEVVRHMYAMKKLGCNLVRVHIAGIDPRIYNFADQLGMLLWVEVPSPHSSSKRSRDNHRAELKRLLALIGTHPSVVIWSLYNEDWGAQDIATNSDTRNYIVDLYNYMKVHYPQFLVVDNDGWNHVSDEGRLESDLLTAHLYTPKLACWQELLDSLESGQLEEVASHSLVVGDPYFYCGQRPLIVSEWGGFGFVNYGGPSLGEERAELIRQFKRELRLRAIAGDVYTQATNIEDERNGLIDPQSGALSVPAGLLASRSIDAEKRDLPGTEKS